MLNFIVDFMTAYPAVFFTLGLIWAGVGSITTLAIMSITLDRKG